MLALSQIKWTRQSFTVMTCRAVLVTDDVTYDNVILSTVAIVTVHWHMPYQLLLAEDSER